MHRQETQWVVEYSRLDIKTRHKEYFSDYEAAAAFIDELPNNHTTLMYPIDEDGRPIVEGICNFNL